MTSRHLQHDCGERRLYEPSRCCLIRRQNSGVSRKSRVRQQRWTDRSGIRRVSGDGNRRLGFHQSLLISRGVVRPSDRPRGRARFARDRTLRRGGRQSLPSSYLVESVCGEKSSAKHACVSTVARDTRIDQCCSLWGILPWDFRVLRRGRKSIDPCFHCFRCDGLFINSAHHCFRCWGNTHPTTSAVNISFLRLYLVVVTPGLLVVAQCVLALGTARRDDRRPYPDSDSTHGPSRWSTSRLM